MKILVIDGQGGGIGKSMIEQLKTLSNDLEIIAVGTNSIATSSMLKSGPTACATGENAILFHSQDANIILGAIGICFANSMHGEISPSMANAISSSKAIKILIPMNKCNVSVLGVEEKTIPQYIEEMVSQIKNILNDKK